MYLAGVLIIANVAVFLWPNKYLPSEQTYQLLSNVKPQFIRLYREGDQFLVADTQVDEDNKERLNCYRLGPFMQLATYNQAKSTLSGQQIDYKQSKFDAKLASAFRLYLGVFTKKAEIIQTQKKLISLGINDHFVEPAEGKGSIVSLGVYSTRQLANKALVIYGDRLPDLKIVEQSIRLPVTYWLYFSSDEQTDLHQDLLKKDWQEPSAKLGKFECFDNKQSNWPQG